MGGEDRREEKNEEENFEVTSSIDQDEPYDPKPRKLFSSTNQLVSRTPRRKSRRRRGSSSSKNQKKDESSTEKTKSLAAVNKSSDHEEFLLLEQLADDVQLHLLEFLSPESARALMSTSHRYRRLLQGEKAYSYWKRWCQKLWPQCGDSASFVDPLNLPTAAGQFYKEANLSLLLSMARTCPSTIDESLFDGQEQSSLLSCHVEHDFHSQEEGTPPSLQDEEEDTEEAPQEQVARRPRHSWGFEQVVRFKGEVGTGNRCIRSDPPLPSCPEASCPINNKKKSSTLRRLLQGGSRLSPRRGTIASSSVVLGQQQQPSGRGPHGVVTTAVQERERPFVVPHVGPDGQIHLTPRFISYYEVTMSEDNNEDAKEQGGHGRASSNHDEEGQDNEVPRRGECVAVGLTVQEFPLDSRMPGWDSFSIGYHGDDGRLYYCTGGAFQSKQFGPKFSTGDTVGCGIDYVMGDVFYTLNGKFLGYACCEAKHPLPLKGMYPTVGLDTNAPVGCNFGKQPFLYDLSSTMLLQQHGSVIRNRLSFR